MMKSKYRPIVTCILLAIIMAATGLSTPASVQAQGFTTPAQINGLFNPDTIYPSQTSRLTINVYNPNSGQLTNVNWTDTLPDDLVVVNPANPVVTGCGSTYTLTAVPTTNVISLSGATTVGTTNAVNPGVCSVTVSVTSFTAGNHTNIILTTDGDVTLGGVVSNYDDDANITLLVLPMSQPEVRKQFSPSTINEGQTSTLTINIENTDPQVALTDVTLNDSLPAGMSVFSTSSISLTGCGSGTLSPIVAGDTALHLTGGTIAINGTCTITLVVAVTGTGSFTNTIHPTDLSTFQKVTIPGDATATLVVRNIAITKQFGYTNFEEGGSTTLTITLTNPGAAPLTNVTFIDTMPAGLSVTAIGTVSGPGCLGTLSSSPSTFELSNGTIPAGGTCTYTATVTAAAAGTYSNSLSCSEITFAGGTAGCADASDSIDVYDAGHGLGVVKQFSRSDIEPGTATTLSINITAPDDQDITGLNLTDNLLADVVVFSPVNSSNTCNGTFAPTAGASSVSLVGGSITRGNTCTLQVDVTSNVYGPHINTIRPIDITNTQGQNITADATATFTVRDISVAKSFASSIVGRNGITTLTITLTNNYNRPLLNISFTDTLPGTLTDGIVIATPSHMVNTCNGSVTAVSGTQTVSLLGGSIPTTNGTCTISVDVRGVSTSATPSASYTNTIAEGNVTGYVNGTTYTQNWHAATADIRVGTPDFRINKKFDPILVTGDTYSTMTITLVNTESSPVSEIRFTDTLPTHMLLAVPPSPSVGTCGGVITPAANRRSFTFSGGALAGNAQCKLTIRAMMEITGNLINTIPSLSVTTRQGMTNIDPTSATLTNLSSVGVVKKFSPNPVSPGSTSTLILDIQKNGLAIGLTGLGMTDTLLHGLTIAPTPAVTNTCGGTLSAPAGGTLISLTGGVMPIGSLSCRITVDVLVPDTGLNPSGYENCIPAGTIVTDQSYSNLFETCDTLGTIFDPPSGYKVFDAAGLPLLEWRMVWINNHNSANINAHITDLIPAGTTYEDLSLTCVAMVASRTDVCEHRTSPERIYWEGEIGPDRGATNEATATNEVIITFRVRVPSTVHMVNNRGTSLTDTDGDGDFTDETTVASVADSNLVTWYRFGRGAGSSGSDDDAKTLPASGFAPGQQTILPEMPDGLFNEDLQPITLEIPSLGVKSEIVGINSIGGKWDVSWLGDKLGYLQESAFPTWTGNSVITGHVFDAQGKPGPFNLLHTLKYGDKVTLSSFGQTYTYEVREVLTVNPDDIKAAFKHEDNAWVTLLTCKGYDSKTNTYQSRVLVRAVLVDVH
jgi:LPXTG-site transpeptidase (sortase) family protein